MRPRKMRSSKAEQMRTILAAFASVRMSPLAFLTAILKSRGPAFERSRNQFYRDRSDHLFNELIDEIWSTRKGKERLEGWMQEETRALDLVCKEISRGMESSKQKLLMSSSQVNLAYLSSWSVNESIQHATLPVYWLRILDSATRSELRDRKDITTVISCDPYLYGQNLVSAQVLHIRSQAANQIQHGLGVFAWATGASRQLIEVLGSCQLTTGYTTIGEVIKKLGEECLEAARVVVETKPHGFSYDNYNASHSQHVEQRPGAPSKVQSGTFPFIYELYNARMEDMLLEPMAQRFKQATPLTFDDISPLTEQSESFQWQCTVHVIRVLTTYHESFSTYATHPLLQYKDRRRLPKHHQTKYYPMRITTIEEASTNGNLQVHDDAYLVHCLIMRRGDLDPWTRREIFQLGIGLFHLVMNLIWLIHKKYAGSIQQAGTLTYFFALLDKVRLGKEKPDYHTLLATLDQILDGLLLHGWILHCGKSSLDNFARTKPSAESLIDVAKIILTKCATPLPSPPPSVAQPATADILNQNIRLITRELLYVRELVRAIHDGDFGRVEDIFPDLARIFRGGGSHNYSNEILHYLYNVKKVWTPAFASVSSLLCNTATD
ncbi:hypothetical protein C8J56DRAFT_852255 [Mycena floridula]|nr:hypothetical protein C8J56DRAFT_852255 [Mycena floridula]